MKYKHDSYMHIMLTNEIFMLREKDDHIKFKMLAFGVTPKMLIPYLGVLHEI